VVLISHNMIDVFQVADRICALYLGRRAAEVVAAESSREQVVELITGGRSGGLGVAHDHLEEHA
jgi:D-xylose transport system ATP-binding protein